jgi:nucleotide-binding universal stress UspA family protein
MKILLAVDGSPCSDAAVLEVANRSWPAGSELKILTVIHTNVPAIPEPTLGGYAAHFQALEEDRKHAPERVAAAARMVEEKKAADLTITTEIVEGSPKELIVEAAEKWGADLVVLGCHGFGPVKRFLLGSVSQAVALHAPCSVQIVRSHHARQETKPRSA